MAASEAPLTNFQNRLLQTSSTLPQLPPMHSYRVGVVLFQQGIWRGSTTFKAILVPNKPVGFMQSRWEFPSIELGHQETLREGIHRALQEIERALQGKLKITVPDDKIFGEFETSRCVAGQNEPGFYQLNFLVDGGSFKFPVDRNSNLVGLRWIRKTDDKRHLAAASVVQVFNHACRAYEQKLGEATTSGEASTSGQATTSGEATFYGFGNYGF